ncbi:MAG: hypothetical protein P0Y53_20500 [Candidatus Pseudobacter hemicellulosilyticus]|uniref:Uncharacterized protein n=1 Tax=Candidatus Pseudobacter hemicellulosilyticus TaxID=3121375 RepID=A0AAJ5WUX2_9BACT|nr:MAG: hypothetical protein P0Y53_20500 [Pseudobacter sp.]
MKQLQWILLLATAQWLLLACDDKKDTGVYIAPGIEFSPATAYQEAAPGGILSFKFRIRSTETVNRFALRVQLPGTTEFVTLPAYPDLEGAAAQDFTRFQQFQYAVPASADTIDTQLRFRFTAVTGSTTYDKDYTVRVVSAGRQLLRLYNPEYTTYFNFDAVDLVAGAGLAKEDERGTQSLLADTAVLKVNVTGDRLGILTGWKAAAGTTFKQATATQFNDLVEKYPAIYAGINAANELTRVTTLLSKTTAGVGLLSTANPYYIAKVVRTDSTYYFGLTVKKFPAVTLTTVGATTTVDSLNEYLQLEIKR